MKYVKLLPNLFDTSFLKDIANELVDENWREFTDVQALQIFTDTYKILVDDYEQLQEIKKVYPKLNDYLKIIKMDPNGTWPLTTMPGHNGSDVCIPIENPLLSATFWNGCEEADDIEDYYGNEFGYWENNEYVSYYTGGKKVLTHVLSDISVMDATIPRQFINSTDTLGIYMVWRYDGDLEDFK